MNAVFDKPAPPVHLVTVLYNSADALPAFLDSLRAQTLENWRLVVVDNASQDKSAAIVAAAADPRISIDRNTVNTGFGRAANQGLRLAAKAGGSFFVIINNDTIFGPRFLADLLAAREACQAPVIAPRIMLQGQPDQAWYAGGHLESRWMFRNIHERFDPADTRDHRRVDFATGCCLGIDRSVLETVGLFDERFFVYWEDTDLSMRLKEAGIPIIYVRDPYLEHEGGASLGGWSSLTYERLYHRSYGQLLRKHFGMAYAIATFGRLMRWRASRKDRSLRRLSVIASSMLAGMAAPPGQIGRLDSSPAEASRR